MNNCAYWSVGKTLDLFAITKRMVCVCMCVSTIKYRNRWCCIVCLRLRRMLLSIFFVFNFLDILLDKKLFDSAHFCPTIRILHSFPSHNRNLILRVEILLKCLSKEAGRNVHTGQSQNTLPPPLSPSSSAPTCVFQAIGIITRMFQAMEITGICFQVVLSLLVTGLKSLTCWKCLKF